MDFYETFELYINAVKKNDLKTVKNYYCDQYLNKFDENDLNGFHHACNLGYMEIVKYFLEMKVEIDLPCQNNDWRGLHLTVESGYEKIGELLLSLGADKEAKAMKGMRPIHCAALGDSVDAVRMLLVAGVDVNALNDLNETALQIAKNNDCEETVKLLERWIGYEKVFKFVRENQFQAFKDTFMKEQILVKEEQSQLTILDLCVHSKKFDYLEFIFLQNIDEQIVLEGLTRTLITLNISNDTFLSQFRLYRSILFENNEEFEKNVTVANCNQPSILMKETFLEMCSRYNRMIFVNKTLGMILHVDESWERAIEIADSLGCHKVRKRIESRRLFVKNRTNASYNRLHIAVQDNNVKMIRYILDNGLIDPNVYNETLGTPLCLALFLGHTESVLALRDYEMDMNITNKFDQTPLHIAIESRMMSDSFNFIVSNDNIDLEDCHGFTPLHLAVINKDSRLSQNLVERGADIWKPLMIPKNDFMDKICMLAIVPLTKKENPITLCMKLHRTIFPSMLDRVDQKICNEMLDDGNSLLHLSSKLLIPDLCEILIKKGSKINLQNKFGNTPFHSVFLEFTIDNFWEMEGFMETLNVLTGRGANINLLNDEGKSVFRCAMDINSRQTLNVVLNQCERVNVELEDFNLLYQRQWPDLLKIIFDLQDNNFKQYLLTTFITESQIELIEFIFDIAEEEFIKSIVEESLFVAARSNKEGIFDIMLEHTTIETPKIMPDGETVLTRLILNTEEKYSVKICDSNSSDFLVDMKNEKSQTALHLAASRGFLKLFKRLSIECQHIEEIYQGNTPLEILIDTVLDTNDKRKIIKLEKIVKSMMKGGLNIYKILQSGSDIISKFHINQTLKNKLEKSHTKLKGIKNQNDDLEPEDKNICEICISNSINCQFGCGHPFCKDCATRVQICPKCRSPKGHIIPLYI